MRLLFKSMESPFTKALRLFLACGIPAVAGLAEIKAQSERSWVGLTGGDWFASENWNPSTSSPNAAGASAVFTSRPLTQLAWDGTVTLGSLTMNGTPTGNVALGSTDSSTDILVLQQAGGVSPVIANSTGLTLFVFANLQGNNGFTKTGTGLLSFTYNPADMQLSGPVVINGGGIRLERAGSVGSGNITFASSGGLSSFPSTSSPQTIQHAGNRTITANPGVTATFSNANAGVETIFDSPLRGGGNFTFQNAGNFTIRGLNNYTGATTLSSARVFLVGSNLSSGDLVLSGNNSLLNLGGANQSVSSLLFPSTGSAALFSTIMNGNLTIAGTSDRIIGPRPNGSVVNLSGLSAFSSNHAASNFFVRTNSGNATNTLLLASGINRLTANNISFGGAITPSGAMNVVSVGLGSNNTIRTNTLRVGSSLSTGNLFFQNGLPSRSFSLRSTDGNSACPLWIIGETSNALVSGQGSVDFSTGTINAFVGNLSIGRHIVHGNNPDTSSLSISSGNLSATGIILSEKTSGGNAVLTSSLHQSGGNVTATSVVFGRGGTGQARLLPTYNLTGGSLAASAISAGPGNYSASSSRSLNLSGNSILSNTPGSNLEVSGIRADPGGLMNVSAQGTPTFFTSNGNITFGSNSTLSGAGSITKNGTGDLLFSAQGGNHSFSGNITVRQGRIVLNRTLPSATILLNGGSLSGNASPANLRFNNASLLDWSTGNLSLSSIAVNGTTGYASNANGTTKLTISNNATLANIPGSNLTASGISTAAAGLMGISVNQSATFSAANGSIVFGSNSSLLGNGTLTKTGTGTLSFLGSSRNHTFSGNLTVVQGEVALDARIASGNLILSGGTLSGNASLANATLNSGTLAPGSGVGNFSAGNLVWNSGTTIQLDLVGRNASDRIFLTGNFSKGTGAAFTFDFKGGGAASGNYVLATFGSHSFNASDFQATNLSPNLAGSFILENSRLLFVITGLSQTIFPFQEIIPNQKVANDPPFAVEIPSASSGLPVALSVKSGNATVSNGTVTLTGAGSIVLAANQPGDSTYAAAPEVTVSFTVVKAAQTIEGFDPIVSSPRRLGDGQFTFSIPASSSGLPVSVTRTGSATLNGTTVTPTAAGTIVLTASQAGNAIYSSANSVTMSVVVLNNPVTLTVVAPNPEDGSITAGYAGNTTREVNTTYSITATPASGMRLLRWLRNGSQVSTSTTYSFSLNANSSLEPVFAPNFGVLQGTYNGLVGDGSTGEGSQQEIAEFPLNNGYITLVATNTGNLTGSLTLENQTDSFSGSFGTNKTTSFSIARSGKSPATADLKLTAALPGEVSGNITVENVALPFRAKRGSYSGNTTVYTLAFPAPAGVPLGYSFATLNFSSAGTGSLHGRLSTNEPFTTTHRIVQSDNGNDWVLPFYALTSLSGNSTGLITGEVVVPKNPGAGVSGATAALEWLRNPNPSSSLVPDGFLAAISGVGSVLSTANGTSMLTGDASSGNFTLTLDPGTTTLPTTIHQPATWSSNNSVSLIAPVTSRLVFSSVARSGGTIGSYSGTFQRNVSGLPTTTPYYGTVFTNPVTLGEGSTELRGAGFFVTGNSTVPVTITVP